MNWVCTLGKHSPEEIARAEGVFDFGEFRFIETRVMEQCTRCGLNRHRFEAGKEQVWKDDSSTGR